MPVLKLDGDATGGVKAAADTAKGVDKIGDAFKKAAKEAKSLEDAAKRIVKENETPLERYNRKNAELIKLFNQGKIGATDMTRAMERYRVEMVKAGESQNKSFGASAAANLISYFKNIAGPGALVAGAVAALKSYSTELDNLNSKMEGGRAGLGQLLQLAITQDDPKAARDKYFAQARKFYSMGATSSLGEAGNLEFALESAGISGATQQNKVGQLLASGVLPDASGFAAAVAAIKSSYPEATPDQILGMGIVAGTISPGDASGVVKAAAGAGQQLSQLGYSKGFGLAATSLLSREFGGPSFGATRIEQFAKHLETEGYAKDPSLEGMDPFAALEKIGAGGTSMKHLSQYFGKRAEAIQAFRSMYKNIDELKRLTATTEGTGGDIVDNLISLARDTPELENYRIGVGSRNRRELSRSGDAATAELYGSLRDEAVAGEGALYSGGTDLGMAIMKILGGSAMSFDMRNITPDVRQKLEGSEEGRDVLKQIERHLRSMDKKTPRRAQPTGPPE